MSLELLADERNIQDGLRKLGDKAFSFRQNMEARVETPVLNDGTDIWDVQLGSKTMNLYGGVNEDKRHRFKIDHEFDLSMIVKSRLFNGDINLDGSIKITEETYMNSKGTEFIIIDHSELGLIHDYAIRADKYESIREQLNSGNGESIDLKEAGVFRINDALDHSEVSESEVWRELAVEKNNASEEDYQEISPFLEEYVSKYEKDGSFKGDGYLRKGTGFYIQTDVDDFKVCPWSLTSTDHGSDAFDKSSFLEVGRLLRVRDSSAEGDAKISVEQAYQTLLQEKDKITPEIVTGLSQLVTNYIQNTQKQ